MIEALKQKLQTEVERLNHEISFVLPKEIEKARAHGDLRENSEYKAALERQQFAQARVHHLRLRLSKLSDVREQDIPRDRVGCPAPAHRRASTAEAGDDARALARTAAARARPCIRSSRADRRARAPSRSPSAARKRFHD